MKLKEFAQSVGGVIIGDASVEISGAAGISEAKRGDITFISSSKFLKFARECKASCIIVKERLEDCPATQLQVSNPSFVFAKAIELLYPSRGVAPGISKTAYVSDTAAIGENVSALAFSYISDEVKIGKGSVISQGVFVGENSTIGENCLIYPNVTIRENVRIGDRVIIHSGTVIGSDGFGYVFENGSHYKIPQVGGVIIEDDVEIGSNVSIDRATLGNTVVARGTKIDNLVQIAHNVRIGENSLIIAQVGIGGSSEIGKAVILAGQVGVADHTEIESGTIIAAQSGLSGRISKGTYSGSPVIPHNVWLRAQALYGKLPDMSRKLRELEERIKKLEEGEKQK